MTCPSCNQTISWIQKRRFSSAIGLRKAEECPHCCIILIWRKWPHWLMQIGSLIFVFSICSEYWFPINITDGFELHVLCRIVFFVLVIPAVFRVKLDVLEGSVARKNLFRS